MDIIKSDLELLTFLVGSDTRDSSQLTPSWTEVLKRIRSEFSQLGFSCENQTCEKQNEVPLLHAQKTNHLNANAPFIYFIGHLDCVQRPGVIEQNGQWLTGPGIADDKAGIVIMLRALKLLSNSHYHANFNIGVVLSPSEEKGSPGFHSFYRKLALKTRFALGFEPAFGDRGDFIDARNGNRWYEIKVMGDTGHAGRKGAYALNATHLFIKNYHQLLSYDPRPRGYFNLTALCTSSTEFNVLPQTLTARIDARFSDFETRDFIQEKINLTFPSSTFQVELCDDCPPMNCSNLDTQLKTKLLHLAAKHCTPQPQFAFSGGAADINYFSTPDNFCIDGFGAVSKHIHHAKETILAASIEQRALACRDFILYINEL